MGVSLADDAAGRWYDAVMGVNSRNRLRVVLTIVLCLLFQQVAVAAYACVLPDMPVDAAAMVEDCGAMGMERAEKSPALCAKHCAPDRAVVLDHSPPSVPPLSLPASVALLWPAAAVDPAPVCAPRVAIDRSDPPPRLRYCSLLI